jgi:hypothetical protein
MSIGAEGGIDFVLVHGMYKFRNTRMNERFSLKVELDMDNKILCFIEHALKGFFFKIPRFACEGTNSAGALRTTKITGRGGFYGQEIGISEMDVFLQKGRNKIRKLN